MKIALPSWLLALIVPQQKAERIWQRTAVTGTSRRHYSLLGGLVTLDFEAGKVDAADSEGGED